MTQEPCQVTHQDHKEGLQDLKERHKNFYQTLCSCIDKGTDKEKYYSEK